MNPPITAAAVCMKGSPIEVQTYKYFLRFVFENKEIFLLPVGGASPPQEGEQQGELYDQLSKWLDENHQSVEHQHRFALHFENDGGNNWTFQGPWSCLVRQELNGHVLYTSRQKRGRPLIPPTAHLNGKIHKVSLSFPGKSGARAFQRLLALLLMTLCVSLVAAGGVGWLIFNFTPAPDPPNPSNQEKASTDANTTPETPIPKPPTPKPAVNQDKSEPQNTTIKPRRFAFTQCSPDGLNQEGRWCGIGNKAKWSAYPDYIMVGGVVYLRMNRSKALENKKPAQERIVVNETHTHQRKKQQHREAQGLNRISKSAKNRTIHGPPDLRFSYEPLQKNDVPEIKKLSKWINSKINNISNQCAKAPKNADKYNECLEKHHAHIVLAIIEHLGEQL